MPRIQTADSDLRNLTERFVACTLPHNEWTHAAHLTVGLWHIAHYGAEEALSRLRVGIRRLNDSHGTANSATSGYHETVTRAYVHLLAEFLERCRLDLSVEERVAWLLQSTLADKDVLLRFYSRETLMSVDARARWVEPDIAPLELMIVLETCAAGGCDKAP
jgi:hypothetical protein